MEGSVSYPSMPVCLNLEWFPAEEMLVLYKWVFTLMSFVKESNPKGLIH